MPLRSPPKSPPQRGPPRTTQPGVVPSHSILAGLKKKKAFIVYYCIDNFLFLFLVTAPTPCKVFQGSRDLPVSSHQLEGPGSAQGIAGEADAGEERWRPLLSKESADWCVGTCRDRPRVLVIPDGF